MNMQKQQTTDQAAKGGVLGIVTYLLIKWNVDAALIAMTTPVLAAILSWASTKIGDPTIASFFGTEGNNDGKPMKVARKKTLVKKVAAKK